jgi:hypothetical protein
LTLLDGTIPDKPGMATTLDQYCRLLEAGNMITSGGRHPGIARRIARDSAVVRQKRFP